MEHLEVFRALDGQCSRRGTGGGAFVAIDLLGDSAAPPWITEDCSGVERRYCCQYARDRLGNGDLIFFCTH
jgi:hypothetical protein